MTDVDCCEQYSRAVLYNAILEIDDGVFIRSAEQSVRFRVSFCPFCGLSLSVPDPDWENDRGYGQ